MNENQEANNQRTHGEVGCKGRKRRQRNDCQVSYSAASFAYPLGSDQIERITRRFWKYVEKTDSCWQWIGHKNDDGYGKLLTYGYQRGSHRVSFFLHKGTILPGLRVLHRCDNPSCVNPDHLFLGTQKDNMQDCWEKGRDNHACGERNRSHKLTEDRVRDIVKLKQEGRSLASLGRQFGVTRQTIWGIVRGINWKHLHLRLTLAIAERIL